MEEQDKKEKPVKRRNQVILVMCILVLAVVVAAGMFLRKSEDSDKETVKQQDETVTAMEYDSNVITTDAQTLQDAVDELNRKAEEGQMNLQMKTKAVSMDGKNFTCFIANSIQNSYDMYIVLYLDETQEEIYRSGLIPLGGRIETFTLPDTTLEPGQYEATLVYNQTEEDRQTLHAQVNVGLTLIVEE